MPPELKPKSSKVKLKLVQPQIMCVGRKPVECYYRGTIRYSEENHIKQIIFKSYGQPVIVEFIGDICITKDWQDLKIIE